MRIIRGKYGRRRFRIPASFDARPTTDFAKENLFNVLENLLDWEETDALDLFAGTGSISFELLSRGCRSVTAIESHAAHAAFISKTAKELKADDFTLIRGDVFRYLRSTRKQPFDFVFADPPYTLKELPELPRLILDGELLRAEGMFVLEHSKVHDFSAHPCFRRKRVYGAVNFSFFVRGLPENTNS
ncbi:MAG: RsmD family RNA methyltransferase [Tannerella sp.]|jgi:16S rRNA (guanine(966)-N(2))-methyltransferase RsmD|nr:RsmD family RNA methyltransferase [Tannerella sp.]